MKIQIAECSGFCFGVKRAIKMAQDALSKNKGKVVYSLGHIIHNSQVVEGLSKEGLRAIRDLDGVSDGVVVVSSHGASPEIFEELKSKGLEVVDATCPYVMSAQKIVRSLSEEGYQVLILGDSHHPEVKSLVGFAKGRALVIKDSSSLAELDIPLKKAGLVSQTTQSAENYLKVASAVLKMAFIEVRVFNTICNDTRKRQGGAAGLARGSDVMLIVGGRMSANTKRLFEISSDICKDTYYVETAKELKDDWFAGKTSVGIASGASTPDWIVEDIKSGITEILKKIRPFLIRIGRSTL